MLKDKILAETVFTRRCVNNENIFQMLNVIQHNTLFGYSLADDNTISVTTLK